MKRRAEIPELSRRDFVKAVGAIAGAAVVAAWLPSLGGDQALAKWGSQLVRGAQNGQILVSEDEGQTWQKMVDFGSGYQVRRIQARGQQIKAQLEFQGHTFILSSTDARTWYTQDYRPPA